MDSISLGFYLSEIKRSVSDTEEQFAKAQEYLSNLSKRIELLHLLLLEKGDEQSANGVQGRASD